MKDKKASCFFKLPEEWRYEVLVAPSVCIEETKIGPINNGFTKIPVSLKRRVSGTSMNIAFALTKVFNHTTKLIGCVSSDPNEPHNAYLQAHISRLGIDFFPLPAYDITSVSTLLIDSEGKNKGNNLILSTKGSLKNSEKACKDVNKQINLCQPRIVIASGVTDKDFPIVNTLFNSGNSFRILNPRPEFIKNIPLEKIKGIDLLILNYKELSLFLDKDIDEKNITKEDIIPLHNSNIPFVIVTCNRHGVILSGANIFLKYEAISCGKAISSTGTGDAFTSAFVSGILNNKTLDECFLWARVFSGLKVTKAGGSNLPTHEEFEQVLLKF